MPFSFQFEVETSRKRTISDLLSASHADHISENWFTTDIFYRRSLNYRTAGALSRENQCSTNAAPVNAR
jgi:hypothetical protein